MKRIVLATFGVLLFCLPSWAAQLKLTTYFPAPNMVIDRATFHPRTVPSTCTSTTIGTIYYDIDDDRFVACHKNPLDSSYNWDETLSVFKQEGTKIITTDADVTSLGIGTQDLNDMGPYSLVSGMNNTAGGTNTAVIGGSDNIISSSQTSAVIVGGAGNHMDGGDAVSAVILGGELNSIPNGDQSAIVGGRSNTISEPRSAIVGGVSNTVSGEYSAIISGISNTTGGDRSGIVGGGFNSASGNYSFIGGGGGAVIADGNTTATVGSTILGGKSNIAGFDEINPIPDKIYATVVGGQSNKATGSYSIVAGGSGNESSGNYSFVGGGGIDTIPDPDEGAANKATGNSSFVGGGTGNEATGKNSFVGGGTINIAPNPDVPNKASGLNSAIIGGIGSLASGDNSFVAGGGGNQYAWENPVGNKATGLNSVAIGGRNNTASGINTVAIGGENQTASGKEAIALGGNATGDWSFAAQGAALAPYAVAIGQEVGVSGTSDYSAGVGGYEIGILNSQESFIGGGYTVTIDGGVRNGMIAGWGNGMRNASNSGVFVGEGNFIQESNFIGVPATPYSSAIVAGAANWIEGNYTVIIGGSGNQAEGDHSIVGGQAMFLSPAADNTFVFGRDTIGATVAAPDAAIFFPGNINGKLSVNEKLPQADLHVSHTGAEGVAFIDSETAGKGGQLYIRNMDGNGCTLIQANHGVLALTDTFCPGED